MRDYESQGSRFTHAAKKSMLLAVPVRMFPPIELFTEGTTIGGYFRAQKTQILDHTSLS